MKLEEAKALFLLAGIDATKFHELQNKYDGNLNDPWWLVKTPTGLIEIGWRKRVINIDWSDTTIRKQITKDDVTKSDTNVHAWGYHKALEYLLSLRYEIEAQKTVKTSE